MAAQKRMALRITDKRMGTLYICVDRMTSITAVNDEHSVVYTGDGSPIKVQGYSAEDILLAAGFDIVTVEHKHG